MPCRRCFDSPYYAYGVERSLRRQTSRAEGRLGTDGGDGRMSWLRLVTITCDLNRPKRCSKDLATWPSNKICVRCFARLFFLQKYQNGQYCSFTDVPPIKFRTITRSALLRAMEYF